MKFNLPFLFSPGKKKMPGDETYRMKRKNISADKLRNVNECIQINAVNGTKTVWKNSLKYKSVFFFGAKLISYLQNPNHCTSEIEQVAFAAKEQTTKALEFV